MSKVKFEEEFTEYLLSHGFKENVKTIIKNNIEKYKNYQAYEWQYNGCKYDFSGVLVPIKNTKICDICHNEIDYLAAYLNESIATYISGCGLQWLTIGYYVGFEISNIMFKMTHDFIFENKEKVCHEYNFQNELTEDNYIDLLDNWEICNSCIFYEIFPEYMIARKTEEGLEYFDEIIDID